MKLKGVFYKRSQMRYPFHGVGAAGYYRTMKRLPLGDEEYQSLARIARQLEFFRTFTGAQLNATLARIQLYGFDSGDTIFKKGDPADAFFIIYEGGVRVRLKNRFFGLIRSIRHLGAGEILGEMGLLENRPRSATVIAAKPTKMFVLLRAEFDALLANDPEIADHLRWIASQRRFEAAH